MKQVALILLATLLMARENPFVLPGEKELYLSLLSSSSSSSLASSSSSLATKSPLKEQKKSSAQPKRKSLFITPFLSIKLTDSQLSIVTKDPLKRAFIIDNPKKAVFDFAKRRDFKTAKKRLASPFRELVIGAHRGYWRLAIAVDPHCKLKIEKKSLTIFCGQPVSTP